MVVATSVTGCPEHNCEHLAPLDMPSQHHCADCTQQQPPLSSHYASCCCWQPCAHPPTGLLFCLCLVCMLCGPICLAAAAAALSGSCILHLQAGQDGALSVHDWCTIMFVALHICAVAHGSVQPCLAAESCMCCRLNNGC
jgi:hypothetical protein